MDNTSYLWYQFNNFLEDIVIANACNQNAISVDVGCYNGRFTWHMGKRSHTVYAFDPSPVLLFRNNKWPRLGWTNPDGVNNIVFVNCGVGEKHHILTYTEYDEPSWNSLYHGQMKRAKDLVKKSEKQVVVVTLDSAVDGNVAFLKVDAEGGDLKVLQGAKRIIQNSLPIIVVESSSPADRRNMINFLSGFGYNVWHMGVDSKEPTNDHTVQSLNLLAIHKTDYKYSKIIEDMGKFHAECHNKDYRTMANWIDNYLSVL